MAKNTYNWSRFPGHRLTHYPSFNPPHPECLPHSSSRYVGQWPIYQLRNVEGLAYNDVPERLKDLFMIDDDAGKDDELYI